MITIRGQTLVSRTNDDPLLPPCVCTKRTPCVDSKRFRVYRHHAHMWKQMCAWCWYTRGRFECTHGGVFESTHWFFHVFSACRNTHEHTHTQTHTTTNNNTTTTTTHTTQHHNTTRRQRQRETERDRNRERQRKRDRERETRQDKKREYETRKEKKREDERGETRKDKRR